MKKALAEETEKSQHSFRPSTPRPTLSPFQAKRIKRQLIEKYCRDELSAEAVANCFELFAELKHA
jgi:hypothetical protein